MNCSDHDIKLCNETQKSKLIWIRVTTKREYYVCVRMNKKPTTLQRDNIYFEIRQLHGIYKLCDKVILYTSDVPCTLMLNNLAKELQSSTMR